jgi:hypothetical protein
VQFVGRQGEARLSLFDDPHDREEGVLPQAAELVVVGRLEPAQHLDVQ